MRSNIVQEAQKDSNYSGKWNFARMHKHVACMCGFWMYFYESNIDGDHDFIHRHNLRRDLNECFSIKTVRSTT